MRKMLLLLSLGLLAVLIAAGPGLGYDVPDEIIITRPPGNTPLAPWVKQVKFPHGMHAVKNPCRACHHKESAKTLGDFVPCRQCHNGNDPNDRTGFFRAWHTEAAPSCLGCHTQMRARGGKNPVGCTTACHRPD